MLILGMDTLRDADLGYARTFLRQAGGHPRPGARQGRQDRHQRRRAQPGGPGDAGAEARGRVWVSTRRSPTSRATTCARRTCSRARSPPTPTWGPSASPPP
ncbi:hypothetical protein [Nocardioides convexus]|uniref:hypothetical protein n=1 Tax=Nocardioides convexus TaxID=2712224 RepID=UPI0031010B2C